ncbi:MAG TPA: hypothetical protein DCF91_13835, partial [Porphyromonadaceae bacterium]|nr:hypothetical protein [Porphyromonadaceae bacterium]
TPDKLPVSAFVCAAPFAVHTSNKTTVNSELRILFIGIKSSSLIYNGKEITCLLQRGNDAVT